MDLTLMNKNTPVLDLSFSTRRGGYIEDVLRLHNPEYAPLGLVQDDKSVDAWDLSDWWEDRCLPNSRVSVERVLESMRLDKQELVIRSLGLSLSDQYWVKPVGSEVEWKDVNFFTNDFSDEVGRIFFNERWDSSHESMREKSPDFSSNGFLKKYWTIEDGERVLVKGGHGAFAQQPYNEVIASEILKGVECKNYVGYKLIDGDSGKHNSVCGNFVDENTEYIPATLIRKRLPKSDKESFFKHFMRCCKAAGVKSEMQKALDYTLMFDYIIANTDRNFGNFGVIRDVESLKIVGVAPIFDNGNSLWYDQAKVSNKGVKAYPFELTQEKQLRCVNNFKAFPVNRVKDLDKVCERILGQNPECSEERLVDIIEGVKSRKKNLQKVVERETGGYPGP